MGDLKLTGSERAGLSIEQNDFAVDSGLENAVLMSLFLDARDPNASAFDEDPRGYWASEFLPFPWGSLLWKLAREKPSQALAKQTERYAAEALAWMVRQGVAERVDVRCSFEKDRILLGVNVKQPGRQMLTNRYALNWQEFWGGYGLAA